MPHTLKLIASSVGYSAAMLHAYFLRNSRDNLLEATHAKPMAIQVKFGTQITDPVRYPSTMTSPCSNL